MDPEEEKPFRDSHKEIYESENYRPLYKQYIETYSKE